MSQLGPVCLGVVGLVGRAVRNRDFLAGGGVGEFSFTGFGASRSRQACFAISSSSLVTVLWAK